MVVNNFLGTLCCGAPGVTMEGIELSIPGLILMGGGAGERVRNVVSNFRLLRRFSP